MPIDEFTLASVARILDAYCFRKIPMRVRGKLDLIWKKRGNNITLYESRPKFNDPSIWLDSAVAQFRFVNNEWLLYYPDRNQKWHRYEITHATKNFSELLDALDNDQTGIFWG